MPRPQFSQMLVERRRQLGYSIGQASRALRLKEEVLEAFEEGDFASMPKSGYAQGMLSSYARFLGLDAREVTDLFADALDDYRASSGAYAGSRRGYNARRMAPRREGPITNQPEVPSRGYLPTSGGIAGDLGDYATTSAARPHARGGAGYRSGTERYYSPTTLGQSMQGSRRSERGYDRYGARRDWRRDDITTMSVDDEHYVDDLRYDDKPRPYAPASTRGGRTPMRDLPTPDRPNVQRRPSSRQRQQVRGRGRYQQPRGFWASVSSDPLRFIGVVAVAAAIVITVILVSSVSSCSAFKTSSDGDKAVPVSQTTTSGTTSSDTSASDSTTSQEEAEAEQKIAQQSAGSEDDDGTTAQSQATVVVTVADDAVTWLEIDCDGSSKVAETVTGPWTQSYVVTSSITVQAADTSSVTVTSNGRKVQFDSRASGIGSVTIKVTKAESQDEGSSSSAASSQDGDASSTSSGTSATAGTSGGSTATTTGSDASGSSSDGTSSGTSGSVGATGSSASSGSGRTSGSGGTVSGSLGGTSASTDESYE